MVLPVGRGWSTYPSFGFLVAFVALHPMVPMTIIMELHNDNELHVQAGWSSFGCNAS